MDITAFSFLTLCVLVCLSCSKDHHKHIEITRANVVEEILQHVGATKVNDTVVSKDIEEILQDLNFQKCSEDTTRCKPCFSAKDVLAWYNISEPMSTTTFLSITDGIFYLLLTSDVQLTDCADFKAKLLAPSTVFSIIKNKYGTSTNSSNDESSIEKILEDVLKISNNKLTNKECFSASDVMTSVNISESEFSATDFEYISSFVILKMLNRNCIADKHKGHTHDHLPSASSFVSKIFSEFGVNSTHMSHETFERLIKKLKLGNTESHKDHDHRKRRSLDVRAHRNKRDVALLDKCYSGENLLEIFAIPEGSYIDRKKFLDMSPALIQQIESESCVVKKKVTKSNEKNYEDWQPWMATIVSVLVISFGSLIGVFAAPFTKKPWFPFVIMFLISLAVAVLIGDAMLHLFPHSLELHGHEEGEHDESHENQFLKSDSFLWKSVLFLFGVFIFFTFEIMMHAFGGGHSHSHGGEGGDDSPQFKPEIMRRASLKQVNSTGPLGMNESAVRENYRAGRRKSSVIVSASGMLKYVDTRSSPENDIHYKRNSEKVTISPSLQSVASDDHAMTTSESRADLVVNEKYTSFKDFKSIVWMVLVGDAIHNFMDGVAVGVAFSESWPSGLHGGISTSIAIFCHELPHELGDFAVLLSSGLSIKQAILMNFISSLSAIIGGFLGCALGTQWNASPWIFAATAGLFVYIALADMLPEALNSTSLKKYPWKSILVLDSGMIVGFIIMFCLAAWEEDIKNALT